MAAPIIDNFDLKAAIPLDVRVVKNNISERNAILAFQRYEGLTVYVRDVQLNYQLRGGILDANWTDIGPMASGSILGSVRIGTGLSINGGGVVSIMPATYTTIGGVIIGTGLSVDINGVLNNTVIGQGGGSATWGTITGTLTSQVDLNSALGTKAPTIHNFVDTTNHPVTGLTGGHFLKATSPTTYGFATHGLTYTDVGAAPSSHVTFPGFGTTGSTACVGNDSRLSDARQASDVYAWAKAAVKPTYTKSDVGLSNVDNTADASKSVASATNSTNTAITNDTATATSVFPVWATNNSGNNGLKVSSTKIWFNPSTGTLSCSGDIIAFA